MTWKDEGKVAEYTDRVALLPPRLAGEAELVDVLPDRIDRVLDLGCGDGRLIAAVLAARPSVEEAIGLDNSAPMIDRARTQFASDERVTILDHDLNEPLPTSGEFDAVVSGFAIHHLPTNASRRCSPRWRRGSPGGACSRTSRLSSAPP